MACVLGAAETASAATFTVTTTSDAPGPATACTTPSSPCSLRDALRAANTAPDLDQIVFAIPESDPGFGGGHWTISPESLLPAIEHPVALDATTQAGASCAPAEGAPHVLRIRLDGSRAPHTPTSNPGFNVFPSAAGSTIRGFSITGFRGVGLLLQGEAGVLCNYLGLAPDASPAPNRLHGVAVVGPGGHVGGRTSAARNVISANPQSGIRVTAHATDTLIEGNYIGTDPTGATVPGPQFSGVLLLDLAARTLIGGTAPGAGNLISGNQVGVEVGRVFDEASVAFATVIQGNRIGTDWRGERALANLQDGVAITSPDTVVGGAEPGAGNLIAGNERAGVHVLARAKRPRIEGNRIGAGATGAALGNGADGIWTEGPVGTIGGPGAAANVIAHNGGAGISVRKPAGATDPGSALILENSIHSNRELGIDVSQSLALDGVTPNDAAEATNPQALNWPTLTSATTGASGTRVTGALDSQPEREFELRFYASPEADPSGHGEGQAYLGAVRVTTDAAGNATVAADLPTTATAGWFVSATSSTVSGRLETSEFGPTVGVTAAPRTASPPILLAVALTAAILLAWLLRRRRRP